MRLRFIGILAVLAMMLAVAAPVAADAPNDCPDPQPGDFADSTTDAGETGSFVIDGTTVYYSVSADGKTISFFSDAGRTQPLVVEFCVKGGSLANSGVKFGSTYTVDFLNEGGQNPAISNFVVYSVATPTLSLEKVVTGGTADDANLDFTFDMNDGTPFTTDANAAPLLLTSASGTFKIDESAMTGWSVSAINCVGNAADESASISLANRTVTVTVGANEDVVCTFTNAKAAAVTGGGVLPGNPATTPVRQGTLAGSLPNTAMNGNPVDQAPVVLLALLALGSLGFIAQRNIGAIRNRR